MQEMLLRSERSFQLWLSPELMMFSSFVPVVLPQLMLLALVHVFFPRQIVLLLSLTCSLGWVLQVLLSSPASGSSGGVKCTLGIGPTRMGSRSLRTFRGLPRVIGVGFDVFPLCVSTRGFEPCHSVLRSNAHLFCFHVQAKYFRAMLP